MKTDFQRFESKYAVSEVTAAAVREAIRPHVKPDPYGQRYMVNSLYLDGPQLPFFMSSEMGEMNRLKLRLRSYGDQVNSSVFFEVKHRLDRVVRKQRAAVRLGAVEGLLGGAIASRDDVVSNDVARFADLLDYRRYMDRFAARPLAMVRYEREAYVDRHSQPVRITFDRGLVGGACSTFPKTFQGRGPGWRELPEPPVVLEIKFTNTLPAWVSRLVQRFHLMRDSVSKYVLCVEALRRDGLLSTSAAYRSVV